MPKSAAEEKWEGVFVPIAKSLKTKNVLQNL